MSKILELAKTFEESSKQQASDIETSVKNAFEPHERAILAALESSARRLNTAIDAQNRRWGWLVLKGWVFPLIGVAFLLGISWVVVWYQGRVIAENWVEISRQNKTLEQLAKKGGMLHLSTCGERQCIAVSKDTQLPESGTYWRRQSDQRVMFIPEGY
ncbi:MbeB family mobilization protein [Aeromonas hydrophila]|uniref:MbeB family mobilization protein n=1 Tax=Aeromonas hydrophila TaxID=644 RepID=UPI001E5AD8CD|nr:MbeB family mobilization protein [Aeromonas hydrophila]